MSNSPPLHFPPPSSSPLSLSLPVFPSLPREKRKGRRLPLKNKKKQEKNKEEEKNQLTRDTSYPMPTVAWLNGHAFAGGLMLAIHHDYRVQNPAKGFLCVNELEFGAPLKPAMAGTFREKLPPATYRDLVLEARRFPGPAALAAGLVDALGGLDEVLALVRARKLVDKGKTGIYGTLKAEMYRGALAFLGPEDHVREEAREQVLLRQEDARRDEARAKLDAVAAKAKI